MASQIGEPKFLVETVASEAGRVVGLAADGFHHFSKSARESLMLLEGLGVEGDIHAGRFVRHRYLARVRPRKPNLRQVHLIPSELLEALRADGYALRPGDLGEIDRLKAGLKRKMVVDKPDRPKFRCGVMAVVRSSGRVVIDDNIEVLIPSKPLKSLPAL
ncbi:MAG TPA: hypothetical protein VE999_01380 [Gemmataceae bacterium]|nr:hypothetical protein [Gemmataceae bacterium]